MNFEKWFCIAVLIAGVCYTIDKILKALKRPLPGVLATANQGSSVLVTVNQGIASVFLMLLTVLLVRSFVVEPFLIPSSSEKPNLLVGDFVLVSKFSYGLRLPVLGTPLFGITSPKRGDTVVFHFPSEPPIYFIKRVIGLPGDTIQYKNKQLTINGQIATQTYLKTEQDRQDRVLTGKEGGLLLLPFLWIKHMAVSMVNYIKPSQKNLEHFDEKKTWPVSLQEEDLLGFKHLLYIKSEEKHRDIGTWEGRVPPGHYFVLGDNRDNSYDSRHWGFVPDYYVVGKAKRVFFSLDYEKYHIRWNRIGIKIV